MSVKNYNATLPEILYEVYDNFITTSCVVDDSYWDKLIVPNLSTEKHREMYKIWIERMKLSSMFIHGSFNDDETNTINITHPLFKKIIKSLFTTFDEIFKDDVDYEKWKALYYEFYDEKIDHTHESFKTLTSLMFEKSYSKSNHILLFWDFMILFVNLFPVELYQINDLTTESIVSDIVEQISYHRKYTPSTMYFVDPPKIQFKCWRKYKNNIDRLLDYDNVHIYFAMSIVKVLSFVTN